MDKIKLIKDSEAYKAFFQFSSGLIILVSKKATILDINDNLLDLIKYKKEEIINKPLTKFIDLGYLPVIIKRLAKTIKGEGISYGTEVKIKTKDNKEKYLKTSGKSVRVYDENNKVIGIMPMLIDFTSIKESEAKFKLLYENMQSGCIIYKPVSNNQDFEIIDFNNSAEKIEKIKRNKLIGKTITEAFPGVKEFGLFEVLQRVSETGKPERFLNSEYVDDRIRGWRDNYAYKLPSGEIVVIYDDTTEQKEAAISLAKQNKEYELLNKNYIDQNKTLQLLSEELADSITFLEANKKQLEMAQKMALVGHYVLDIKTGVWSSSKMLNSIFGIDEESKKSIKTWLEVIHPDYVKQIKFYFQKEVLKKHKPFDKEYKVINQKTKEERWVRCLGELQFDNNQNVKTMFGTIQDITESKETAARILMQNEYILFHNERLESLLRIAQFQTKSNQELLDYALNEAILLTKSKIGYIYFYNEETQQFTLNSWSNEVMKECSVVDQQTVYDLDKTGCWGEAVRQKKPIIINDYNAENPIKKGTPKGHVKLFRFLTIPVVIDNRIVAVAGVANKENDYNSDDVRQLTLLMDNVWRISERISLITDLEKAKKKAEENDALKTAFLANMSHEIRTPMNGIIGFSRLLNSKELSYEKVKQYLSLINRNSQQLLGIINDIVDISKIETGQFDTYKVETSVNTIYSDLFLIYSPIFKEKNIKLIVNKPLPDDDVKIYTDHIKLRQIIENFLRNAFKYTHEGIVEFGYNIEKANLVFYVSDTGIGIERNMQEIIFERFRQVDESITRKYGGTGLGLAIAKSFAELLGGEIKVESELGKGSKFFFIHPYNRVKSELNNIEFSLDNVKRNLKIMVVEDDEVNFMYVKELLVEIEADILHAKCGKDAIVMFKSNPDIQLVLLDIKLPDIDGYEVLKSIRSYRKDVPVIAQTAFTMAGDKEEAIKQGCDDYISKPIDSDELFKIISKY